MKPYQASRRLQKKQKSSDLENPKAANNHYAIKSQKQTTKTTLGEMVKRSFLDWWPPNENENLLLLDSRHQQLPWILAKKFIDFAPSKYSTKNISLDHQKLVFVPYLKKLSAPFPPLVNCAC